MRIRSPLTHMIQALAEGALVALLAVSLMAGAALAAKPQDAGSQAPARGTASTDVKSSSNDLKTTTSTTSTRPDAGATKTRGGGKGSCTRNAPGIAVDNSWSWSGWGSYGLPGQQLTYALHVINYDTGCAASSFVVSISAPDGFSVSIPTDTISLKSSGSAYLWGYVTAPAAAADGDYPLTVTVVRAGTSGPAGSFTTYFKVYSSDTEAPTLFWPNPGEGTVVTDRTYTMVVSARDDHAVKSVSLYVDGVFESSTACDDISDSCQLDYNWSTVAGQHVATFTAEDWLGNVGSLTVNFSA